MIRRDEIALIGYFYDGWERLAWLGCGVWDIIQLIRRVLRLHIQRNS